MGASEVLPLQTNKRGGGGVRFSHAEWGGGVVLTKELEVLAILIGWGRGGRCLYTYVYMYSDKQLTSPRGIILRSVAATLLPYRLPYSRPFSTKLIRNKAIIIVNSRVHCQHVINKTTWE